MKTMMPAVILTITALLLSLEGCGGYTMTPQYDRARTLAQNGNSNDVEFCKYEAAKAPIYGSSKFVDSSLKNLETNERQMGVFNACMEYRAHQAKQ